MDLYSEYGKLIIQAEILNARIQEVKGKIAQELNIPKDEQQDK